MKLCIWAVLFSWAVSVSVQAGESYAIIGDAGWWNKRTEAVRDSIERAQVTQLVLPGDNLYKPWQSYNSVWKPWSSHGLTFDVVAIGNHTRGYKEEVRFFKMPGEYFTTVKGSARFIVLNSDNEKTAGEQIAWLRSVLAKSQERFNFLVYHHPTYTVSERHHWREKEPFQLGIRAAIAEHAAKITGIIVGHDHIATLTDVGGIPMIVSGAIHESVPTPAVSYRAEDGLDVDTRWIFSEGSYWVRLDVLPEAGEVWADFVRTDQAGVSCTARIAPRPMVLRENCAQK